ncbi:MAG: hypothetical protein AAGC64_13445 [Bacteroidota bacterium]
MIILVVILLLFVAVFILYNTSKKAQLGSTQLEKWVQGHPKIMKMSSFIFIIIAFALLFGEFGFGGSFFSVLLGLMAILSLQTILTPMMRYLRETREKRELIKKRNLYQ